MTTLVFPDLDTLSLAITAGAVPESISQAPARGGVADDGSVAVQTSARLPRATIKELERIGAQAVRSAKTPLDIEASCWMQLLPVQRDPGPLEIGEKTPVLFEIADELQLPELVTEILRLGNDRQSFRYLEEGKKRRALLRVMGPPFYSLLRALEGGAGAAAPRAYVQRGRAWVEVGYTHPLAERIQPAANQMLLIGPPHRWTYLDEAKFRDIYSILEFVLPKRDATWQEVPLEGRIRVPLCLAPGGPPEAGELWVLDEDGVEQLDALVSAADDQLISRLAFAVGERGGKQTVVLRARPSKEPPPVLVLRGVAYRPYLKLPNLFLPVGRRLHPPLRRDAVAKLLAPDRGLITWLAPADESQFSPQSLPDDAFRPLSDWVEYVLDHEQEALAAWVASTHFDFEPFVCQEGEKPRAEKASVKKRSVRERPQEPATADEPSSRTRQAKKADSASDRPEEQAEPSLFVETPQPLPLNQVEQRLHELETEFTSLEAPPDAPQRRALWSEMARANAALERRRDATICWSNAFWEDRHPPPAELRAWLHDEERTAKTGKLAEGALPSLLAKADSRPIDAGALAAYVVWASEIETPPPELTANVGAVAAQLERQESNLPIRAAWLAWRAVARLSGGDVLALAKARDRALERLFQAGLRPEFDLPSFLRMAGQPDTERFRLVRENLETLREQSHQWLAKPPAAPGETAAYADLMFAYGLARLGEITPSLDLLRSVEKALPAKDEIHRWLAEAFAARIRAVNEGRLNAASLADDLLARLKAMEPAVSYKIEKLRTESRILEPFEKFDPYRRYVGKYGDDLGRRLLALIDQNDREKLYAESHALLQEYGARSNAEHTARVLAVVLQLAPRLGETFARESLALVPAALKAKLDLEVQAVLLERGLLLAAHFNQGDYVQTFVARIRQLLAGKSRKEVAEAFESLVRNCFHSLRKLGMRDALDGIFRELTEILRGHGKSNGSQSWFLEEADRAEGDLPRSKDLMQIGKVLLQLADGWFYYGHFENARESLDDVRMALLKGKLEPFPRMKLTAAYLAAYAQAPVDYALKAIEEVFARLPRGESRAATSTHYGLLELNVIEAAILALVGDGFHLNAEGRRWLDEDEFVVRRRIHRDVAEAIAQEGR